MTTAQAGPESLRRNEITVASGQAVLASEFDEGRGE